MSTPQWYSAMLRVTTQIAGRADGVWGTVVLFRATGWEEAHQRALALGRERERAYANVDGDTVRNVFTRVETLDCLGGEIDDGREVYSEHLADAPRAARELEGRGSRRRPGSDPAVGARIGCEAESNMCSIAPTS